MLLYSRLTGPIRLLATAMSAGEVAFALQAWQHSRPRHQPRWLQRVMTLIVLQGMPSEEEMVSVSNSWRPYRSLGSWLMWRVPAPASPAKAKRKSKPKDASTAPDL